MVLKIQLTEIDILKYGKIEHHYLKFHNIIVLSVFLIK